MAWPIQDFLYAGISFDRIARASGAVLESRKGLFRPGPGLSRPGSRRHGLARARTGAAARTHAPTSRRAVLWIKIWASSWSGGCIRSV